MDPICVNHPSACTLTRSRLLIVYHHDLVTKMEQMLNASQTVSTPERQKQTETSNLEPGN